MQFDFTLLNNVLMIKYNGTVTYGSNLKRIFEEAATNRVELFIFDEICEYNEEIKDYKFEFCSSFLKFAKEINR